MDNTQKHQPQAEPSHWFAIKTPHDFRAEEELAPLVDEIFFPVEKVNIPGKRKRVRAIIPRVLFIKTTVSNALHLEREGRKDPSLHVPFWIYRYPKDNEIQVIHQKNIDLLRLLTASDTSRCQIFSKSDFKEGEKVRVIGGQFKGYEGSVVRVKKNRHVIVRIEGICMIMLPLIHPDLLQTLEN